MEHLNEKLSQLREERNKHNQMASELQNEIDKIEMQLHEVPDYIGKYIMYDSDKYTTIFAKVKNIKRLSYGVRLELESEIIQGYDYIEMWTTDCETDYSYNRLNEIQIISKERYDEAVEELIDFVKEHKS